MSEQDETYEDIDDDAGIDGYEPSYVDVDGIRTRYYDVGDGDPLVLIHGNNWSGSSSANTWSKTFEFLRERFRVLAFDRVGCGMTENPADPEAFVYQTDVDHALGFLDAMGLESCHLAGWSRGGGLATRIAVEEPERFDTLIICNSATLGPPAGDGAHRRDIIFEMDAHGLEKTDPAYMEYFYRQYSHQRSYITDERVGIDASMERTEKGLETTTLMYEEGRLERWQETLDEHMNETHQRIKAGELTMPVLYVFGRNDPTVPPVMALATFDTIAQHNPAVRMKIINHCGHMIFLEHPEEFSRTVIEYVDCFHG
ncbi:alpha/beta fold hydrolase [Natronobiforma cellulositropha]|uniref:alpha/beta fold hydrolase n=1 Tax=Natronobiforma cellulositropha TaxID=1679076 RepID=UPI0021D5BDCE|nr:alpha/beta hydrolase [Natronobiforma cellulositropha]